MFLVFKSVRDKSCRKKLRYIKPMLKGNFVSKYCKIKIKSVLINVSNITLKYIYNSVEVLMAIPEVSPSRAEGAPVASS